MGEEAVTFYDTNNPNETYFYHHFSKDKLIIISHETFNAIKNDMVMVILV